jgi:NAD(P)-dependent dehydrogenase (short-subunit alcohol dehydrogenase family)
MPKYLDRFTLTGKTAVVTGGAQGIGLACVEALAEAGAHVVIADLASPRQQQAKEAMAELGFSVTTVTMDVSESEAVEAVAETVEGEVGAIDILVNCAGIGMGSPGAESVTDELWRRHMQVNLDGTFYCCRSFGKRMLTRGSGAIVNIGSMSGVIVNKPQPQSYYNASKAAVHHLTRSLAAEWAARGVRVNAVAPTYIETPLTRQGAENPRMMEIWMEMTPMHRMGQPSEIASVVLFLASDAASLLTGSIVLADGGYTCW